VIQTQFKNQTMKKLLAGLLAVILAVTTFTSSAQVIFSEDFVNGIPGTWTTIDNDGFTVHANLSTLFGATSSWVGNEDFGTPGDTVAMSTSWYNPANTSDDWLISPQIALTSNNTLSWGEQALDASYRDGYELRISTTTPDTSGFNANPPLLTVPEANGAAWLSQTLDLQAAGYANQNIYLAWINNSTDKFILMIDDIVVAANLPNDVAASNPVLSEYTSIPLSQVSPLSASADMTNNSASTTAMNPQMGFAWTFNVSLPIFSSTTTQDSLAGLSTQTFTSDSMYTPTMLGDYRIQAFASMDAVDEVPSNNTTDSSRIVSVTSDYYSRDNNALTSSIGIGPGVSGFMGQDFEFSTPTTLSSVQLYLTGPTLGDTVVAQVFDQVGNVPNAMVASSDQYVIGAGDTAGVILTLPIVNGNSSLGIGRYTLGMFETLAGGNVTLGRDIELAYEDSSAWAQINDLPFATVESLGFPGVLLVRAILCDATAPSITGFSNTGAHGTTVSWTGQSLPEAGGFVIRYKEYQVPDSYGWKVVPNENATSAYVNGLDPGTRYVFRVGSKCNMNQNAAYSDTSSVWTRNSCSQPTFYFGSAFSPTDALVGWGNPDGDNYKMRFRSDTAAAWMYRNGSSSFGTDSVFLSDLMSSTTYQWQARSLCDAGGNRPYGPMQYFITPSPRLAGSMATQVGVYPNPTNGNLTIDFNMDESANLSLQLMEMSGRVVSTSTVNAQEGSNRERLDLSDLAPGFYLIRMVDANGVMLINERVSKN
jgi:hypothetical protein